jgi:hypothetical protein
MIWVGDLLNDIFEDPRAPPGLSQSNRSHRVATIEDYMKEAN